MALKHNSMQHIALHQWMSPIYKTGDKTATVVNHPAIICLSQLLILGHNCTVAPSVHGKL